jgi:hypothetical protein
MLSDNPSRFVRNYFFGEDLLMMSKMEQLFASVSVILSQVELEICSGAEALTEEYYSPLDRATARLPLQWRNGLF